MWLNFALFMKGCFSTEKCLEWVKEYSKVVGFESGVQKSVLS